MKKAILLLPIAPITLSCAPCVTQNRVTIAKTASGSDIEVVHVAQIKAAKDAGTKKGRIS
jgi:hypothetical protein